MPGKRTPRQVNIHRIVFNQQDRTIAFGQIKTSILASTVQCTSIFRPILLYDILI
jgi:hypothetical protein